jgi:hypothetical protein
MDNKIILISIANMDKLASINYGDKFQTRKY